MDIKRQKHLVAPILLISFLTSLLALLVGCGGEGASTLQPPPPPAADFSISASPSTLVLPAGASNEVDFRVDGINGFSGQVQIALSGLPGAVTPSSQSFALNASSTKTITFTAAPSALAGDYTITATGTSGGTSHQCSVPTSIPSGQVGNAPSRSTFIDVDFSTYNFVNGAGYPGWRLSQYDPIHKLFYMSVTFGSEIVVISPQTEKIVAKIPLPQPFGIDFSLDYSKLYVATTSNYLYVIDTSKLQVSEKIDTTTWGGVGYTMVQPFALVNGKIGFQADLANSTYIWSPADNSVEHVVDGAWSVIRSEDGTKLAYSNAGNGIGIFDVNTHVLQTATPVFQDGMNLASAFQPGQNHFLVVGGPNGYTHAVLYDENLQILKDYTPANGNLPSSTNYGNGVFRKDGSEIYLEDDSALQFAVLDASTFQVKGYVPRLDPAQSYLGLFNQDVDETGLVIGASHQGAVLTDTAVPRQTSQTAGLGQLGYLTPSSGPINGGTAVHSSFFMSAGNNLATSGAKVFFGAVPASNVMATATGNLSATTPPNISGVVNVGAYFSDGNMTYQADGFSYGPSVHDLDITASTADGGKGTLYGYGLASGATVSINGATGNGTASTVGFVYSPGPGQKLTYAIPPGTVGQADFTLQTQDGMHTYSKRFRYYPAPQKYDLAGSSQLWMGAYDSNRKVMYFTESNRVDVFDVVLRKWLDSIVVPAGTRTRTIRYLAISPNATTLAVTDSANQSLIVIDLSTRQFVKEIALSGSGSPDYFVLAPIAFASDTQVLTLAAGDLHLTDVVTGATIWNKTTQFPGPTTHTRMTLDATGKYLLFNSGLYYDLQEVSDPYPVIFAHSWGCDGTENSELAISSDSKVSVGGCFLASDLYLTSVAYWSDAEWWSIDPRYGEVWDPTGTFALQPTAIGVDVVDFKTGAIRERISTNLTIPEASFSAVSDPETGQFYMITDQGIAAIDLSVLPMGLNSVSPISGNVGTTVEIFGTGFDSNTVVSIDGHSATATLVDSHHLQFSAPAHEAGPVRIAVTAADGSQDFIDAAFLYGVVAGKQGRNATSASRYGIEFRPVPQLRRRSQPQSGTAGSGNVVP